MGVRCSVRCGFTLIELVAVIVVLAILSGVAIPKYFDYAERARVSAAQGACGALVTAVQNAYLATAVENDGEGAWPENLDDVLEGDGGEEMLNPYHVGGMPVYNIDRGGPNKWHPQHKTIERALRSRWGSIWYNPDNGALRFRVAEQEDDAATLALYNRVNNTDVSRLNQTSR